MNTTSQVSDGETRSVSDSDDPTGRLSAYMSRTRTALDLLALLTLWIVVVPPGDFSSTTGGRSLALAVRIGLSVVYGIDMAIRATLAKRHWRYVRDHPVGVFAVIFPPVRVLFSLRLVASMFRRGNLARFMLTAAILMLNGAVAVWLYERHVPGANIRSLEASLWWAVTTVTTVGYGDYFPVTIPGQLAATFIMAIGILVIAVVTAQVASSFVDEAARRRSEAATDQPRAEPSLTDLDLRLARIEALLTASSGPGAGPDPR